jgi:hypothetical protein
MTAGVFARGVASCCAASDASNGQIAAIDLAFGWDACGLVQNFVRASRRVGWNRTSQTF